MATRADQLRERRQQLEHQLELCSICRHARCEHDRWICTGDGGFRTAPTCACKGFEVAAGPRTDIGDVCPDSNDIVDEAMRLLGENTATVKAIISAAVDQGIERFAEACKMNACAHCGSTVSVDTQTLCAECRLAALPETSAIPQRQENKEVTTRMGGFSTSSDASRTAATDVAEGERPTTPTQVNNQPDDWPALRTNAEAILDFAEGLEDAGEIHWPKLLRALVQEVQEYRAAIDVRLTSAHRPRLSMPKDRTALIDKACAADDGYISAGATKGESVMEQEIGEMHWSDNWMFKRLPDGSVRIRKAIGEMTIDGVSQPIVATATIPPNEWASVILHVADHGAGTNRVTIQQAIDFHGVAANQGDTHRDE